MLKFIITSLFVFMLSISSVFADHNSKTKIGESLSMVFLCFDEAAVDLILSAAEEKGETSMDAYDEMVSAERCMPLPGVARLKYVKKLKTYNNIEENTAYVAVELESSTGKPFYGFIAIPKGTKS